MELKFITFKLLYYENKTNYWYYWGCFINSLFG